MIKKTFLAGKKNKPLPPPIDPSPPLLPSSDTTFVQTPLYARFATTVNKEQPPIPVDTSRRSSRFEPTNVDPSTSTTTTNQQQQPIRLRRYSKQFNPPAEKGFTPPSPPVSPPRQPALQSTEISAVVAPPPPSKSPAPDKKQRRKNDLSAPADLPSDNLSSPTKTPRRPLFGSPAAAAPIRSNSGSSSPSRSPSLSTPNHHLHSERSNPLFTKSPLLTHGNVKPDDVKPDVEPDAASPAPAPAPTPISPHPATPPAISNDHVLADHTSSSSPDANNKNNSRSPPLKVPTQIPTQTQMQMPSPPPTDYNPKSTTNANPGPPIIKILPLRKSSLQPQFSSPHPPSTTTSELPPSSLPPQPPPPSLPPTPPLLRQSESPDDTQKSEKSEKSKTSFSSKRSHKLKQSTSSEINSLAPPSNSFPPPTQSKKNARPNPNPNPHRSMEIDEDPFAKLPMTREDHPGEDPHQPMTMNNMTRRGEEEDQSPLAIPIPIESQDMDTPLIIHRQSSITRRPLRAPSHHHQKGQVPSGPRPPPPPPVAAQPRQMSVDYFNNDFGITGPSSSASSPSFVAKNRNSFYGGWANAHQTSSSSSARITSPLLTKSSPPLINTASPLINTTTASPPLITKPQLQPPPPPITTSSMSTISSPPPSRPSFESQKEKVGYQGQPPTPLRPLPIPTEPTMTPTIPTMTPTIPTMTPNIPTMTPTIPTESAPTTTEVPTTPERAPTPLRPLPVRPLPAPSPPRPEAQPEQSRAGPSTAPVNFPSLGHRPVTKSSPLPVRPGDLSRISPAAALSSRLRDHELAHPPPPKIYPLTVHLVDPDLLKALLIHLNFYDWCKIIQLCSGIRRLMDEMRDLREEVLERFLRGVGYIRWTFKDRNEGLALSNKDLNAYMRGVSMPTHRYGELAEQQLQSQSKTDMTRALAASTRAYTKVVLRLRSYAEAERSIIAESARRRASAIQVPGAPPPPPPPPSTPTFKSPLFRLGHAPLLRVFVPSAEGSWLSDASVMDCERELKRAGVVSLLQPGDVVWDTAVGEEGNSGRLIWDGNYLIDLDYTYSYTGEIPRYLHSFNFPPSYFHKVVRSAGNPICQLDLSPWAREIAANLQLLQDRVQLETPQGGRHTVVRWIHRTRFFVRASTMIPNTPSASGGLQVDPGWDGLIVLETEGTNEGLADLKARCGISLSPSHGFGLVKPRMDRAGRAYRLLRERSRPGEIWIRTVNEKERLL